ncbi:MAG TPA: PDZ domain-containing protein [Tepidisphaeraceae bacterium]|nr:PDZ domain-containing protein [Tepidisphaeraceae bacterium]
MNPLRDYRCVALLIVVIGATATAQAQTTFPTLKQISEETQALYAHIRPSTARVQFPPPQWAKALIDQDELFRKWDERLSPEVRKQLHEQLARKHVDTNIQSSTQPSEHADRQHLIPRSDGGYDLATTATTQREQSMMGPRSVGLVLDDGEHVVVPYYIEKDAIGDATLNLAMGDGTMATATFVGSDRPTNLTVLKLSKPSGKAIHLTGHKPAEGALVMLLAASGDSSRLVVWTGGQQENGVVVTLDGDVAGFTRYGQFLAAHHCRPVVEQIIRTGSVRRAVLGVLVTQTDAMGPHESIRVDDVARQSPAEGAGIRRGDIIRAVSGEPIVDLPTFAAAIAVSRGATKLQIDRDGKTFEVTVDLQPK